MSLSEIDDQAAIFAFLGDPATYGRSGPVTRIDTHAASVFLAGPDVYKVKRAVRFPFLDFSTLEKRRHACEAEVAVNRDNAPGIYLGVVPITDDRGRLTLGGAGAVVEWAVHMRRFDETATLDHVAARGHLDRALIDRLAAAVAAAHARAPVRDGAAATVTLGRLLRETADELAEASELFPPGPVARFGAALVEGFEEIRPLLEARGAAGQVRRCHGDLHLANIVLIDDAPVLFDAIEFDDAIATSDILYDLAFLLMDLCERGLRADANRLLNRYLAAMPDPALQIDGLAALPVFLALRAAIRAKVLGAQARRDPGQAGKRIEALAYFDAADRFLVPVPPRLVAVGGLSGTGKTTLATALAPVLGRAPGAVHLRSDVERKRLLGVPETEHLPDEAYRPEISEAVFARLLDLADRALAAGQAAVLDAVYQREAERVAVAELAARHGVPFTGLWLEAPLDLLRRRVRARHGDASDATEAVVAAQAERPVGTVDWHRLDAGRGVAALQAAALDVIGVPPAES